MRSKLETLLRSAGPTIALTNPILGRRTLTMTARVTFVTTTWTMMESPTIGTTANIIPTATKGIETETASGMSATCVLTYQTMNMTQIKTEKQTHATTTLTAMGTKTPWAASLAMPARGTTTARFMPTGTKRTPMGTAWETSVTTAPKIRIQTRQIPMRMALATSATGVMMVTAMESLTDKIIVVTCPTITSSTMTTTIREMSAMMMTTMTGNLMTTTTASLSL